LASAREFWTTRQAEFVPYAIDPPAYRQQAAPVLRAYLEGFGDVDGKVVLDLGCGNGELAVYAARLGATVWAVDFSASGVRNTGTLAEHNGVGDRVQAVELDAMAVADLGPEFDLVIGKNVLHHLEPFQEFVGTLHDILGTGGRGWFLENSARNPLLMLARRLRGRFGIAKFGDDDEHPLAPAEIDLLRGRFPVVKLAFPTFVCFRMLANYVLRGNAAARAILRGLDEGIAAVLPFVRQYSYRQIVEVVK
jgi:SAM-dependent methyltransferase